MPDSEDFLNNNEFLDYISDTLIPDLHESGHHETAEDFQRLLSIIGDLMIESAGFLMGVDQARSLIRETQQALATGAQTIVLLSTRKPKDIQALKQGRLGDPPDLIIGDDIYTLGLASPIEEVAEALEPYDLSRLNTPEPPPPQTPNSEADDQSAD